MHLDEGRVKILQRDAKPRNLEILQSIAHRVFDLGTLFQTML